MLLLPGNQLLNHEDEFEDNPDAPCGETVHGCLMVEPIYCDVDY